jgi:hypothetical protein
MPDEQSKRTMANSKGYDIRVVIGDVDYTSDVSRVRIVSSITAPYQFISIDLTIDEKDVIAKKLYGQEEIKLTMRWIGNDIKDTSKDDIKFTLVQLKETSVLRNESQSASDKSKEPSKCNILTVPKEPLSIMSTVVNEIFENKNPKEMVEALSSKTKAKLVMDSDGVNTEKVKQVLIPPLTLYKAIKYIDDNFGIFKGATNLGFCQYDNSLTIINLTEKIKKSAQALTIYHIANDDPKTPEYTKKCVDGKSFCSFQPILNDYIGNASLATMAYKINYVLKPTDVLYSLYTQTFTDLAKRCAVMSKPGSPIYSDPILNTREIYHIPVGDEKRDSFVLAQTGRALSSLSTMVVNLQMNIPITNLLKVGDIVKLDPRTPKFSDYAGMYILKSSDLEFTRESQSFGSQATVVLCRTNKTA